MTGTRLTRRGFQASTLALAASAALGIGGLGLTAAGAAAAAFYRTLVPLVAPIFHADSARVDDRTRAALEREKMLVLRSIKELEFDRAMGKLSQKDFDEMSGRLRARAVSLMKRLDRASAGYGEAIEAELNVRLATVSK